MVERIRYWLYGGYEFVPLMERDSLGWIVVGAMGIALFWPVIFAGIAYDNWKEKRCMGKNRRCEK